MVARAPTLRTSLNSLEWPELLEHLAALARTESGKQAAHDLPFNLSAEAIRSSLERISEARYLLSEGHLPDLAGLTELTGELNRARRGATLSGEELWRVLEIESVTHDLQQAVSELAPEIPVLAAEIEALATDADFLRRLSRSVGAEGEILDTASPTISALRRDVRARAEGIRKRLEEVLDSEKFRPFLQDTFFTLRENRYVVPLKMGAQAQIDGIVHDTSNTEKTVFVEPREVVEANNKLKMAERELSAEEDRIRAELTALVRERSDWIEANARYLMGFDLLLAKARLSNALGSSTPEPATGGTLRLYGLVHPLLRLAGEGPIPNDLELSDTCRLFIVSGPNAGGKTVLLKALGLAALMLKAGLPVPAAAGSAMPVFGDVFADIGDPQSIAEHLSSFSGHAFRVTAILQDAGPDSLVILDEIMAGTDPAEGAALARALLEHFEQSVALTAVSTHFDEIKALGAAEGVERVVGSMQVDPRSRRPIYRLEPGTSGRSLAFEAAAQVGLPAEILDRARSFLSPEQRRAMSLLENLDAEKERLADLQEAARGAEALAGQEKHQYQRKLNELREREKRAMLTEYGELREEISRVREELKRLRRQARIAAAQSAPEELELTLHRADELAAKAAGHAETGADREPVDWSRAHPGDVVKLSGSRQQATLLELPDQKGLARIEVGGIRMEVKADRLVSAPRGAEAPATAKPFEHSASVQAATESTSPVLDLRGQRGEEAIEELERFLDRALISHLREVRVIHGHGDGILKKLVRDYLRDSEYAISYRPGERAEGGDGVTVATLA